MKDLTRRAIFTHGSRSGGKQCNCWQRRFPPRRELLQAYGGTNDSGDGESPSIQSLIFPKPQEISSSGSDFVLRRSSVIVVPADPRNRTCF